MYTDTYPYAQIYAEIHRFTQLHTDVYRCVVKRFAACCGDMTIATVAKNIIDTKNHESEEIMQYV